MYYVTEISLSLSFSPLPLSLSLFLSLSLSLFLSLPPLSLLYIYTHKTKVVMKSKSPAAVLGTPPPLSGGTNTAAASAGRVVVSRPGSSTMVQVSPQVRPPLRSLTTPTPPSLTPSPKRPLPTLSSQTISPVRGEIIMVKQYSILKGIQSCIFLSV